MEAEEKMKRRAETEAGDERRNRLKERTHLA
jgi:hypothetical protein